MWCLHCRQSLAVFDRVAMWPCLVTDRQLFMFHHQTLSIHYRK